MTPEIFGRFFQSRIILFKFLIIKVNQCNKLSPELIYHRFQHQRLVIDDSFNLFRVYILSAGPEDHILEPSFDIEITMFIEHSQVSGPEPAVRCEYLPGLLFILIVSLHYIRPFGQDLSLTGNRIGVVNFYLLPRQHNAR